jgi:hypothetical protein
MYHFPLYEQLVEMKPLPRVTKNDMNQFVQFVENSQTRTHEYIYLLIYTYALKNNQSVANNIPYQAQEINGSITFQITHIPPKLRKTLVSFMKLESKLH